MVYWLNFWNPCKCSNWFYFRIYNCIDKWIGDYWTDSVFLHRLRQPIESLRWSWKEVKGKLIFWTISCLIGGVIIQLFKVLGDQPYEGLLIIFTLLLVGLLVGLFDGLSSTVDIEAKTNSNQGIRRSIKISIAIASIGFLLFTWVAILLNVPLFLGATIGLTIGWYLGGTACVIHYALRIVFCCTNCMPWNYARFLNYATERLFLQKVGGGYLFIHRSLMEHFTQMDIAEK